jgi:hypothetical protein
MYHKRFIRDTFKVKVTNFAFSSAFYVGSINN